MAILADMTTVYMCNNIIIVNFDNRKPFKDAFLNEVCSLHVLSKL